MYRSLIIILSLAACGCNSSGPKGAYEGPGNFKPYGVANADSVHLIKLFMNGYWMAAIFGNGYQTVYNIVGGQYVVSQGVLHAKVEYSSGDTSVIGTQYDFKYSMDGAKLKESTVNVFPPALADLFRKEYTPIPRQGLKKPFLEGVWMIRDGQVGYTRNGDQYLKIYAYPRYAWVHYNPVQKRFIAAGGGTYQLSPGGDTLIEKVDYTTYKMAVGTIIEKMVKQNTWRSIMCFDVDSFYDEELWERKND